MLGAMKQSYRIGHQTFGNSTISGSVTSGVLFSNTVSSSTYLTFMNTASYDQYLILNGYTQTVGNLTVTGNTAQIDILLVGAGGTGGGSGVNGNISGGNGGQVIFYPNVTVGVGTYQVSLGVPPGLYTGGNGIAYIGIGTGISANPGTNGSIGRAGTQGGTGANGANLGVGYYGGAGLPITSFGTDITWLGYGGNLWYGAGGSGINYLIGGSGAAGNAGGYTGGGGGNNPEGYSPDSGDYTWGVENLGGGGGGGDDANAESEAGVGGSGVIIIRHRSS